MASGKNGGMRAGALSSHQRCSEKAPPSIRISVALGTHGSSAGAVSGSGDAVNSEVQATVKYTHACSCTDMMIAYEIGLAIRRSSTFLIQIEHTTHW